MQTNELNGDLLLTEGQASQAQAFFESLQTVNLDEVTTNTVKVAIRDSKVVTKGGRETRVHSVRIAEIENFVPMRVFNRMLASRERVMRERKKYLMKEDKGDEMDPMIFWMLEQVLAVWQQTEEDMTRERLENGLDFTKISKLFTLFFGQLLQMQQK